MRRWLGSLGALLLLSSCQAIWGFEDLEPGAGSGGTSSSGGDGSNTGSGTGTTGVACSAEGDCESALTCLYGFCRPACDDDNECEAGSGCLRSDNGGGCSLASETCESGSCENADLVCGLDAICRVACSDEDSCEAQTQRCIAGTCVSKLDEDYGCGAVDDGQIACNEGVLSVCNVTGPGLVEIEDCGGNALCESSLPADSTYDPEAPPECAAGCPAGKSYCEGATLRVCEDDGSGPVDAGEKCATAQLCEAAEAANAKHCPAAACAAKETRCGGGETELQAERCTDGLDAFAPTQFCDTDELQCNPATGKCFALEVDATEVTVAAYATWLAKTPATTGQPKACEGNGSFAPDTECMKLSAAPDCADCTQPVVCVDWCDAYAYCQAQGQHLCGKIGGGMNPYDRYADAGSSEWMNACSAGGQFEFGSGEAPIANAQECSNSGSGLTESYVVTTRKQCKSPSPTYKHLFDMSGNVEEWEDSCTAAVAAGTASAADACRTRGGSFKTPRDGTRCDAVPASAMVRSAVSPTVGFRCCGAE